MSVEREIERKGQGARRRRGRKGGEMREGEPQGAQTEEERSAEQWGGRGAGAGDQQEVPLGRKRPTFLGPICLPPATGGQPGAR